MLLSRIHVRVHVHGILIEFRQVASRQSSRCACVCYRCCGSLTLGSTINVSEVMNLRKLAQARPTMPCIPLVMTRSAARWPQKKCTRAAALQPACIFLRPACCRASHMITRPRRPCARLVHATQEGSSPSRKRIPASLS